MSDLNERFERAVEAGSGLLGGNRQGICGNHHGRPGPDVVIPFMFCGTKSCQSFS